MCVSFRKLFATVFFVLAVSFPPILSAGRFDSLMKLRADAPGGAFTGREALTFRLVNGAPYPETYAVQNHKREIVAEGKWPAGSPALTVKPLPHGHYILKTASGECSFAVLPDPAERTLPAEAPFALDTHITMTTGSSRDAGYGAVDGFRLVAELCRRAGAGFLRDRISWKASNPGRGQFRLETNNAHRSAPVVSAHDIRILSVYHDAPAWTKNKPKQKLPLDLFAIYEFNRRLAGHFRGKIDFWEFWNEQDIGFADAAAWDYAAAMKAAYLGFKAGNPEVTVLTGPFCAEPMTFCRSALKSDLPLYFDVLSYHTYLEMDQYPKLIGQIREVMKETGVPVSKPIWFSEVGTRVEGVAEISGPEPGLREHSFRQELAIAREVPKLLASLQQLGVARIFWFNLMPVFEWGGGKSWGMLRRDYTVKASYTAFATLTAQLGAAKPEGELKIPGIRALLYRRQDSSQSLLAWAEKGTKEFRIPGKTSRTGAVNLFGTPIKLPDDRRLMLDGEPVYLYGLAGLSPAVPAVPAGIPGVPPTDRDKTVVLRAILPEEVTPGSARDSLDLPEKPLRVAVEVCNFDTVAKTGVITVGGDAAADAPAAVTVPPNGKNTVELVVTPKPASLRGELVFGGEFNGKQVSRLVIPLFLSSRAGDFFSREVPMEKMTVPGYWVPRSSGKMTVAAEPQEKAVRFSVDFPAGVDRWVFPRYRLQLPQESLAGAAGIVFEVRQLTPGSIRYQRINAGGDGYGVKMPFEPPETEWCERRAFFPPGTETEKIRWLEFGCNPNKNELTWQLRNIRVFHLK